MKAYALSLLVGIMVGVIYGLLKVKSPAPPVVALVGLFGLLAGEQLVQQIRYWRNPPAAKDAESVALKGTPASVESKAQ